mgnify:CR=1 FL=1
MKAFENKTTGVLSSVDMKKGSTQIFYWLIFAIMLFVSIICFLPPLWILLSSMKDTKEFLQVPPTLFPHTFQPKKIGEVWGILNFYKLYANTLLLVFGDLVFTIIINGLGGFVISRLKPKGSSFIMMLVLWTMMLPGTVSMIPLFKTFIDIPYIHINITNTYLPMWLMAGGNAFYVLLFKNFFDSIPISYVEAAKIDGGGDMKIFTSVILPLSTPVVFTVSIFTVNNAWGDFFWPFMVLKNKQLHTVSVALYNLKQSGYSMDKYMVALLLSIIPPSVMFVIFQKQIMGGINIGGIKG